MGVCFPSKTLASLSYHFHDFGGVHTGDHKRLLCRSPYESNHLDTSPYIFHRCAIWVWLKIKREGQTAGFGPCFHLPGQPILEFRFFEPQPEKSVTEATPNGASLFLPPTPASGIGTLREIYNPVFSKAICAMVAKACLKLSSDSGGV